MNELGGRPRRRTPLCAALAAAVGVLAACTDPTQPALPDDGTPADAAAVAAPAPSRVAPGVFEDVQGRLLASFADQARAAALRGQLAAFSDAYERGDDAGARAALARAGKLLEKGGAHAANLSALRLAIGQAEAILDSTTAVEAPNE